MKGILISLFFTVAVAANVYSHEAFTLISSEKKTVKAADLAHLEHGRSEGKVSGTQLVFTDREIDLVVTTGPEDDMLSYRIQGMRNPTLVVPSGVTMRILFINTDVDMRHDVRFGHKSPPFDMVVDLDGTAGSGRLTPRSADGILQAEAVVLKANSNGEYVYFCAVRGHAKGGMWGNVAVGVNPGATVRPPEKIEHIHSPDEDKKPAVDPETKATPPIHVHETPAETKLAPTPHDHNKMAGTETAAPVHSIGMSSTIDIGDPMNREGSGTSWLPDSSPMYAWSKMYEDGGMLMLMGTAYLRYTQVGSSRDISIAGKGDRDRFDLPNMFMAMYSRPLSSKSQLGLRVMASLDPITQRGYGYPLLYQSGELFHGEPIHDRQHPHDFISELAASYSYKTTEKQSFFVYGGIAGEPALGPPMFMHRPSGMNNPDAPIGHHWQDASHISWGVVTGGYNFGKFKIEGSVFNGTEPDENRWSFDRLRLNSFSGRFSFNPTKDLSFQISHAYLKNPERSEPDLESLRRTTASAIFNKSLGDDRNWASTFVWGQNYKEGEYTNSFLFESDYSFGKNAIFGRIERVDKDGHELVLEHDLEHDRFWVGAYSLGYVRDLVKGKGIDVGLGGMAKLNTNPSGLSPVYGGTTHGGWQVFLRIRPSKMRH
ncbi:MAG: sulfocyanin-like copper-binding protein [Pyrinomonadaceae bacterium]